jgi:hypothetical protein
MKKYLVLCISALLFTAATFAQSTAPRFGLTPGADNTSRVLTNTKVVLTDAAGADSAILSPRHSNVYVDITLLDSFTLKQPVVTGCFYGDQMIILLRAASGTPFLKFTGANWITAGKATLSTNLRGIICLQFDGAKWVEVSRVIQ